jgi:tetratricopeptide (TPR) repeat protein
MRIPSVAKQAIFFSLILALGASGGCGGEKKPPVAAGAGAEGLVGNPQESFKAGVDILTAGKASGKTNYAQAYTYFDNATKADPGFVKANYNAGFCAERLGRLEDAESHYRAALKGDPGYTAALQSLAAVLSSRGNTEEAITLYDAYLKDHPDATELKYSLIDALILAKRYDDAVSHCRDILAKDKKNGFVYNALSRIYFEQGQYEMSLLCAEKAKTLNEGDANIYNAMGITYLKLQKEPSAIEKFKEAIKLNPAHRDANMNLGWLALNSGDYVLARRCFEAVTNQYPGDIDALLGLAVAQRGTKDLEASAQTYDAILKLDPTNKMAYFNAATLHEKYTKDYSRALKYLQTYVDTMKGKIGPDDPVFVAEERVRKSEEAEKEHQRQIEIQKKEEEERKKRLEEKFAQLKVRNESAKGLVAKYGACPAMVQAGVLDTLKTVIEQAQSVIDANDPSLAGDMMTFFDQIDPEIQAVIPICDAPPPAPPAPAPAETPVAPSDTSAPPPAAPTATEPAPAPAPEATPLPVSEPAPTPASEPAPAPTEPTAAPAPSEAPVTPTL